MNNLYYQRLQLLMTVLGYYEGACDGVWGAATIAAKVKWEDDDDMFEPAVPNNGLPFAPTTQLPECMTWKRGPEVFMTPHLSVKVIDELLKDTRHRLFTVSMLSTENENEKETSAIAPEQNVPDEDKPTQNSESHTPQIDGEPRSGTGSEAEAPTVGDSSVQPQSKKWTDKRKPK